MYQEIMIAIIIIVLFFIIYSMVKIHAISKILKNIKSLDDNQNRLKKQDFENELHLNILNKTAHYLESTIEKIPDKIKELKLKLELYKKDNKKMVEDKKGLKQRIVQLMTDYIIIKSIKVGNVDCFFGQYSNTEDDILREVCGNLTNQKNSVIFLLSKTDSVFIIVACSDDISKKGFNSLKITKFISQHINGSFGGKKDFSMFKSSSPDGEKDIFSYGKNLIIKELNKIFY